MEAADATVVVSRSNDGFRDRVRKYRVLLDGVEIGRSGRGERVEATVAAGRHMLALVIDWTNSSVEFEVIGGRDRHFMCSPGSPRNAVRDLVSKKQWITIEESGER